jgi:hypothetical protein
VQSITGLELTEANSPIIADLLNERVREMEEAQAEAAKLKGTNATAPQ